MVKRILLIITLFCLNGWLPAEGTIKQGPFKKMVILTGNLKARRAENLDTPPSNTWQIQIKWMVEEGTTVQPGDPVVRFDTSNLVTEIENLENSLQVKRDEKNQKLTNFKHQVYELETKVKQAELRYKIAKLDADIPKGIDPEYDYEKKQLNMKKVLQSYEDAKTAQRLQTASLKAELKKVDIEIEEARSKLRKYKKMLGGLTLHAKTSGTVVYGQNIFQDRKIQVGDNVFSSLTVATIPDKTSLYVDAWVDETDMKNLRAGQQVDLQLDAYPQKKFRGEIQDILKNAERRRQWGRGNYFNVLIQITKRDHTVMKSGMSVKCCVHVDTKENALLVPLAYAAYHNNAFWIKPRGKGIQKVEIKGINHMYLCLGDDSSLQPGTVLDPLGPKDLKENAKQ